MVWGCISSYGLTKIVILEGKITSQVYLKLMQEVIIPEGKRLFGDDFILQQDNAPTYTSKIVKKFITDSNIQCLVWPPQSPDLSPIENVWAWLKKKISEKEPRNMTELKDYIMKTWSELTSEDYRKYTLSMQTQICNMSVRNGGHCGY